MIVRIWALEHSTMKRCRALELIWKRKLVARAGPSKDARIYISTIKQIRILKLNSGRNYVLEFNCKPGFKSHLLKELAYKALLAGLQNSTLKWYLESGNDQGVRSLRKKVRRHKCEKKTGSWGHLWMKVGLYSKSSFWGQLLKKNPGFKHLKINEFQGSWAPEFINQRIPSA